MPSRHDTASTAGPSSPQLHFPFVDEPDEAWRPADGWPGYDVSDRGRFRGWRGQGARRGETERSPRILSVKRNRNGSAWVCPVRNGKPVGIRLDQLVLDTFVGPRPHAHECSHLDDDPGNCDVRNLRWVLPPEFAEFPDERWRLVAGWDGAYEVSDLGRVRTWTCRSRRRARTETPALMSSGDVHGYKVVTFKAGDREEKYLIHRMVLEAFIGPCPDGMECRHLDGNRGNNRLDNLCWGTKAENEQDKILHGTLIPAKPIPEWEPILFFDPFIPIEAILPWEAWKPIDGYAGYEVSNRGRIASFWSQRGGKLTTRRRIRKGSSHGKYGHLSVMLRKGRGEYVCRLVHRLIIDTFSPQPDPALKCRHVDGNAANNHISNLRWGTIQENQRDRFHHGTDAAGERCYNAKLTEDRVVVILRRLANGDSPAAIARDNDVSNAAIHAIRNRRTWRHISA